MKKLLLVVALWVAPLITANEGSLHTLINKLSDHLYCAAEMTGGGKDGNECAAIIAEYVTNIKSSLQQKDISVNQFEGGLTPLMLASYYHQWEVIDLLLKAGADRSLQDKDGRSSADYVVLRANASPVSIAGMTNLIMSGYFTEQRYHKCLDLLVDNTIKRMWLSSRNKIRHFLNRIIYGVS